MCILGYRNPIMTRMKTFRYSLLLASLLLISLGSKAQAPTTVEGAVISFEKDLHDFGELQQGDDASFEFKFTNTGSEDLIISQAKKSCGCTVPEYSTDPVPPGGTGVIKVVYDSRRIGNFNKYVTVMSNSVEHPQMMLKIKGKIATPPSFNAAPVGPVSN